MSDTASNFELNILKLGIHTFQLMKGDRFTSNGSYFHYEPCKDSPNTGKGKKYRYQARQNYHSAVKYEKDVKRADNIKLIKDEVLSIGGNGQPNKYMVWEVQYAYTVEIPKNENLILLSIELTNKYTDDQNKRQWEFKTQELEVQRVTDKQLFLKERDPISFSARIEKKDLNNVRARYGDEFYLFTMMEDYNEAEIMLVEYVEKVINDRIANAHEIIRVQTDNLNKFLLLKSKQGY